MRRMWTLVVALIASLLQFAGPVPSASAGVLMGTLQLKAVSGRLTGGASKLPRDLTDAVIYVEKIPPEVERKLIGRRRFLFFRSRRPVEVLNVVQRTRFSPRVASIAAGSSVAFYNLDKIYHNVFSVSSSRRFDLGKNAPGARDTVAFERAGVVNLHCDIHPEEQGYLVVTPNHAYTRPESLGTWRLPVLPPGKYTLRVFHPRVGEFSRTVEMPARGDLSVELKP
ncbi:MAG: hypothetical protein HOP12_05180 [Candidatus Eisenbacteria bacterium]|uniref:Rhamnogalacturonan lyase domain-containing protein n=1 Tax=Eiseniibacteriota bacterium TaxID=2212470 RepID=A0A849SWM8_UNCEI|nr:hypothetical protein [Candidatus Eisenbacteria bacterium]